MDEGVGVVGAEGVDKAGYGGDLGAEEGQLGCEDVAGGVSVDGRGEEVRRCSQCF